MTESSVSQRNIQEQEYCDAAERRLASLLNRGSDPPSDRAP
jgi:hypothetical protein